MVVADGPYIYQEAAAHGEVIAPHEVTLMLWQAFGGK